MVIARNKLIRSGMVGSYHVINRTIRRAFLSGFDAYTGKDFSYRKLWIENRFKFLSECFSIDVCGFSVMSNHYHLILRIRPDIVESWSPEKVARNWWQLFPKRRDSHGHPEQPKDVDLEQILFDPKTGHPTGRLGLLRSRLMSISWFMRCLNEFIAKKANREDECTGRFWEGRFKSTELLDQAAMLACLAYVDLNPIHAGIASTPEASDFTSAQKRIQNKLSQARLADLREQYQQKLEQKTQTRELENAMAELKQTIDATNWLSPMARLPLDQPVQGITSFLNMELEEYLELLDWTGRQHRLDKKGQIPDELETILRRLEIDTESWLKTVKSFDSWFHHVAGTVKAIREAALVAGSKWFAGIKGAKTAFT